MVNRDYHDVEGDHHEIDVYYMTSPSSPRTKQVAQNYAAKVLQLGALDPAESSKPTRMKGAASCNANVGWRRGKQVIGER